MAEESGEAVRERTRPDPAGCADGERAPCAEGSSGLRMVEGAMGSVPPWRRWGGVHPANLWGRPRGLCGSSDM